MCSLFALIVREMTIELSSGIKMLTYHKMSWLMYLIRCLDET